VTVAYPSYLAATLSGASLRQLQYWREQKILGPELRKSGGRIFYSYRDVLALRTFVYLREEHSLQLIRRAIGTLRDLGNMDHLSQYSLVAGPRQIVLVEEKDVVDLTKRGQLMAAFMRDVFQPFVNMQGVKVVDLRRPRKLVSVDPDTQGGYPVIVGTRIQFDLVASLVADGVDPGEIKDFYPGVSAAAARDAESFARIVHEYREGRMPSAA
jgi:uncharacterized protein (DUF433 family)